MAAYMDRLAGADLANRRIGAWRPSKIGVGATRVGATPVVTGSRGGGERGHERSLHYRLNS